MKYKRTGRNTSSLYNHMKSRHADKLETEIEITGAMDKYVTKEIPVSISFLFLLLFLYYIFHILTNSNKTNSVLLQHYFDNFLSNGLYAMINRLWLLKM